MRSAKRTAKLSIVLGGCRKSGKACDHPALESPLAERVGGWPARSAVLPERKSTLFIVTWILLLPVCLLIWAVIIMTVYKFLHW
jgi:hypothetical protein